MSDALPATQTTTWLAQFSMYCICIVGTVILETCLCAYLSSELRKGPIPPWCRHVITGSKIFHHAFYSRRTPSSSRTESTAKSGRDVENANTEDMSGLGDVALNAMHKGNSSVDDSNRNNGCVTPSVVPSENAAESVVVKSVDNCASRVNAVSAAKSTISLTQKTPLLIEPCDLDETDYIQGRGMDNEVHLSNDMSHKSEWVQLSHAIDRFARVLFPLVFVIMAITMFARVT